MEIKRFQLVFASDAVAPMSGPMTDPAIAAAFAVEAIPQQTAKERLVALWLNTKLQPIGYEVVSEGGFDQAAAAPREILTAALYAGAAAIILAHNHPSGDITPSQADVSTTRRLMEAGELIDIRVLDHIIIGTGPDGGQWVSLRDRGLM